MRVPERGHVAECNHPVDDEDRVAVLAVDHDKHALLEVSIAGGFPARLVRA